jgi:hypothetical protein
VGWWRLAGVMDSAFAGLLDDAKASFDFMLNSSFLALVLALLLLAYAARFGAEFWAFLWRVALFGLTSRLAYLAAVDRAKVLGNLERAAIDLFRSALLTKLGFKYDFGSVADERAIWKQVEIALFTPDRSDDPPYQPPAVAAAAATSAISAGVTLSVLRSIRAFHQTRFPSAEVELTISDPAGAARADVAIMDALPASWCFVAGSAAASAGTLTLVGTSPFSAKLDAMAAGATVNVTYRIQAWKAGNA